MGRLQHQETEQLEDDVTYCEGRSRAWGAKWAGEKHLGWPQRIRNQGGPDSTVYVLHPRCMNCGSDMGCQRCSGVTRELFCNNCKDWAHPDARESHGRLLHTPEERAEAIKFLHSTVAKVGKEAA